MVFKFYINDIEIDEPVGFDATKIMLKRSDNWHGVLSEASEDNVEIYGQGFEILSALYNEFGIDAVAKMRIEYYCSGVLEDNVEYNITFYDYKEYCGNDCYCEVGIERAGCYYQFRNAMETKVNLDALTSIDKTTLLSDYEYLGKEIEIPGKTIVLSLDADNTLDVTKNILTDYDYPDIDTVIAVGGTSVRFDIFHADRLNIDELDTSDVNEDILFKSYTTYETITGDNIYLFNNQSSNTVKCGTENQFNIKGRYKIFIEFDKYETYGWSANSYCQYYLMKTKVDNSIVIIDTATVTTTETVISEQQKNYTFSLDRSFDLTETIEIGEKIRFYLIVTSGIFAPDTSLNNKILKFNIIQYKESFINITNNSLCNPTPAKLYLPNEALSHISEYNTNNCMRVYSEFLGRTDSQPYSQIIDGCGGMLGITNGLFLRQLEYTRTGDKTPILSLSFNEILEALNCINPIGFSIEKRGEDEVVRVENWEYFYNDSIVVDLGTVSVKKEPDVKLHFKNFKTGYAKYEAEEYNGLDEFLTEREYTTNLVNHNLELNKTCQFIASGYAIELTRRTGNTTSSDWRFDNDTFVIALKRSGSTLDVEQGNITSPLNIIDPPTILNFRISPARMAMNWFQYLTTFLKTTKELIFSSGKGNIAAQGESYSNCTIESGVISEKQNLLQADFQGNQDGIFTAELHTISEAPMTFKQYKLIQSNPHGLIAYKCSDVQLYGWIKELKYSFIDGSASFILIPKVNI